MDPRAKSWLLLTGSAAAAGGVVLLLKWMERRGWVNLRGSAAGAAAGFGAVREVLDPPVKHVVRVREEKPRPGASGDPPGPG